jgi:hypothetical protein
MRTTSRLALCAARGACAVCTGFVQTSNSAVCTVQKAVDVCDFTYEVWYERSRRSKSAPRRLNLRDRLDTPCWELSVVGRRLGLHKKVTFR